LFISFSVAQSCLIGITLLSFNSTLVVFVANLLCVWFMVVAPMVQRRRGGFCKDVVVWYHEIVKLRFEVKEWPINEVG
jgi:hypothetical protein